jgi:predicted acetyltransferase
VELEIRPVRAEESAEFVTVLETAAGRHPTPEALAEAQASTDLRRTLAAFDGGHLVGATASEAIALTVPGPVVVSAAKITLTGLLPTHRGRGLASALMRRQLPELRRLGSDVAVLTTSQSNVPARHGFRPATLSAALQAVPGRAAVPASLDTVGLRLVAVDEAARLLPQAYDAHRLRQVGQVTRSRAFWDGWFRDRPLLRIGPSARFIVVAEDPAGACVGYLTYRLGYGALREDPVQTLFIEDLVASTDPARRSLWAYCLAFEQAGRVRAWNVPIDDPVLWMVDNARSPRLGEVRGFLRLRVLKVNGALASRRYAADDSLVLEVADDTIPANTGRWRLTGAPEGASCVRCRDAPDLTMTVSELAAVYLGGVELLTLARAGLVTEHRPGALRRADAMLRSRPAPWTVTDW